MNSFMSWVGGKKALREEIVRRFPLSYERYIEVFGGGGWVLFHKPPGRDFEVYNDFNSLLANLYRCVRDRHEELIDSLRYVLNSREDFELIKQALARDKVNLPEGQREDALGRSPASDVQKASWFYQIIRYGYKDICFPCTKEFHQQFHQAVLDAYQQTLAQIPQRQQEGQSQDAPPAPEMKM